MALLYYGFARVRSHGVLRPHTRERSCSLYGERLLLGPCYGPVQISRKETEDLTITEFHFGDGDTAEFTIREKNVQAEEKRRGTSLS
jgi:hypothetical protein